MAFSSLKPRAKTFHSKSVKSTSSPATAKLRRDGQQLLTSNPASANTHLLSHANPWENENQFIKQSREILLLAEQMNIRTLENESACTKALVELPSSQLISLQREISAKKLAAIKLKEEIAFHERCKESQDILSLNVIESRMKLLKRMSVDLETVLRNKEKIITRLQTPFVGDFIKVDANYHKFVHEIISDLVPSINDISHYLDNISWLAYTDLKATDTFDSLLIEIQSLIASLQTSFQMLCGMKTGVEEMKQKYHKLSNIKNSDEESESGHLYSQHYSS